MTWTNYSLADLPSSLNPTAGETLAQWNARIAAYDAAHPGTLTFLTAANINLALKHAYDLAVADSPGSAQSGHVVEDEGTPLTARTKLNFIGAGVTVTDNSGADSSDVTISGTSASDASTTVKGVTKLATAPVTLTAPIAVGDNDPRVTADQAAGTASIRTLGTGAAQATAGNDARLSDTRTPTDGSVTAAKVNAALKPSGTAATTDESLRALGTTSSTAAPGNDSRFAGAALNTQTTDYTLVLTDAGKVVEINSASAQTVTVPTNTSVAFPIGTIIEVRRYGAGTVAIAAAGGVTVNSPGALLTIGTRYSSVSLQKRATNEWILVGDLA